MNSEFNAGTSVRQHMDPYSDLRPRGQSDSQRSSASINQASSIINVNDLPLPTDTSESSIFQSAIFIEDGIQYRSIQHRIDPKSLKFYRIYYSKYVRWTLGVVIFVNLILAFFEYPTSLSLSSDYRFRDKTWHVAQPHCGVIESIEILCLIFFLVDCTAKFYLLGWRRFLRKPWQVLYAFMIVMSFIDLANSLAFCHTAEPKSLGYTLRLRRFCRPLFFLLSSTIMKKFTKAAVFTLPQIFSVLVLLVLHLYIFAMVGLLVFPRPVKLLNVVNDTANVSNSTANDFFGSDGGSDYSNMQDSSSATTKEPNLNYSYYVQLEGKQYFSSVSEAFVNLLVLLTTANHPDIMIPIYQFNRFASIYFILFLGIGAFIILNLLIAATYNQFKGFFKKSLQSSFFRRRVAFRAAFTLLARKTHQIHKKGGSRVSYIQEVASKELIRRLLQKARIPKKQVPQMYTKLETMASQCLNWQQFREVFDLVSKEPTRKNAPRLPYYGRFRACQWLQFVIRHKYFAYFTYGVSILNVILMTIELQISYDDALSRADSRLAYYNLAFVFYYVLEQIIKLIGLGYKGYFRSIGNVYEGLLTIFLLVLEILVVSLYQSPFQLHRNAIRIEYFDILIRLMNIIIVLRLLRIVAHVKSLRLLIGIVIDLIKNLSGFAGILVVIYYLFALLGMELFQDVDGPSKASKSSQDSCGTYDNLTYYANNFHDFASSVVTLWDVMIVNNWFIFLNKFAQDSMLEGWSKLYFIAWWLVAAIICMNLFVSLVLETFLIKWEAVHGRQEEGSSGDRDGERFGDSNTWDNSPGESQSSDIHSLLSAQLVEPQEADLMHELHRHRDLMLA